MNKLGPKVNIIKTLNQLNKALDSNDTLLYCDMISGWNPVKWNVLDSWPFYRVIDALDQNLLALPVKKATRVKNRK